MEHSIAIQMAANLVFMPFPPYLRIYTICLPLEILSPQNKPSSIKTAMQLLLVFSFLYIFICICKAMFFFDTAKKSLYFLRFEFQSPHLHHPFLCIAINLTPPYFFVTASATLRDTPFHKRLKQAERKLINRYRKDKHSHPFQSSKHTALPQTQTKHPFSHNKAKKRISETDMPIIELTKTKQLFPHFHSKKIRM